MEQKTLFQNPVCLSVWPIASVTVDPVLPECCELSPFSAVPGVHGSAYISSIQEGWPQRKREGWGETVCL